MEKTFYSNGKLMITGEYVVLDGATTLALPTKFGQSLTVSDGKDNQITWKSYDSDNSCWFETVISFIDIITKAHQPDQPVRNTLVDLLYEAHSGCPDFLKKSEGYNVTTRLTFPRQWGLGTSSTLVNNIAQWLHADAYALLKSTFGGSGYDIACAQNNTPIIYTLNNGTPSAYPVTFSPTFTNNIWFVYLNEKQNSRDGIATYRSKKADLATEIPRLNEITSGVLHSKELTVFADLLKQHEAIISSLLEIETVKERLFPDFPGTIKSLGAWGGDFIMAVAKEDPTHYFKTKGYETILRYEEMIL